MRYIHLFTVRSRQFELPILDSLLVIDTSKHEMIMDYQLFQAIQELSHLPDEEREMIEAEHNRIMGYHTSTNMRLRFNCDIYQHILKLEADTKLDMDDLDHYMQNIESDELQNKLQEMEL